MLNERWSWHQNCSHIIPEFFQSIEGIVRGGCIQRKLARDDGRKVEPTLLHKSDQLGKFSSQMIGNSDNFGFLVDQFCIGLNVEGSIGNAHDGCAAKDPEAAYGLLHGRRQTDEFQSQIDSAAMSEALYFLHRVAALSVDGDGAEFTRRFQLACFDVDGKNLARAECPGELDGRAAQAADTEDGYRLARL